MLLETWDQAAQRGNCRAAVTQAGPGKVENMDGLNCYAVATLFAEPGKTRKNPAKSMDFPREVASVVS
ncbi:MAG: hypothetical protein P8X69_10965 [Maritimibacter sp.]